MGQYKVSLLLQKCAGLGSRLAAPSVLNILKTEKISVTNITRRTPALRGQSGNVRFETFSKSETREAEVSISRRLQRLGKRSNDESGVSAERKGQATKRREEGRKEEGEKARKRA